MVSLLWMVFTTTHCSVSSANLTTIQYSSESLRDGVKRDPEVQFSWLLLALSKKALPSDSSEITPLGKPVSIIHGVGMQASFNCWFCSALGIGTGFIVFSALVLLSLLKKISAFFAIPITGALVSSRHSVSAG